MNFKEERKKNTNFKDEKKWEKKKMKELSWQEGKYDMQLWCSIALLLNVNHFWFSNQGLDIFLWKYSHIFSKESVPQKREK